MKNKIKKMDLPLLFAVLIFLVLGLIMIFSASNVSSVLRYKVPTTYFFGKQLKFVLLALAVGFIIILNYPTKYYKRPGYAYLGFWIIGLFLLTTYGKVAGGAQSWYNFGRINIQPSEFIKPALIIALSCYYSTIYSHKNRSPIENIIPFIITAIIGIMIALQPDMGGAAIIILLMGFIFFLLPDDKVKKQKLLLIIIGGIGIFTLILINSGSNILDSYQFKRFQFTNPCSRYTEDTGYQVCNGYIAIHNGGLLGKGLGNSTQKYLYLPEAHTDFIFPIICEELGCLVGAAVILLYGFILFRITKIARAATNIRNKIMAYGIFFYLLIHILINLVGVLALLPLTGVPLPFLSYGGSYVVNVILSIFIVERISIENNSVKKEK